MGPLSTSTYRWGLQLSLPAFFAAATVAATGIAACSMMGGGVALPPDSTLWSAVGSSTTPPARQRGCYRSYAVAGFVPVPTGGGRLMTTTTREDDYYWRSHGAGLGSSLLPPPQSQRRGWRSRCEHGQFLLGKDWKGRRGSIADDYAMAPSSGTRRQRRRPIGSGRGTTASTSLSAVTPRHQSVSSSPPPFLVAPPLMEGKDRDGFVRDERIDGGSRYPDNGRGGATATAGTYGETRKSIAEENVVDGRTVLDLIDSMLETAEEEEEGDDFHRKEAGGRAWGETRDVMELAPRGGRLYQYVMHNAKTPRLTPANVVEVVRYLVGLLPGRVDIVKVVLREHPRVLRRCVDTQLRPTERFLRSLYGDDRLVEALARNPSLLLVSGVGFRPRNSNNEGDTERFLTEELGMSSRAVRKLKNNSPFLFQLSVEERLRPTTSFLASMLTDGNDMEKRTKGGEQVSRSRQISATDGNGVIALNPSVSVVPLAEVPESGRRTLRRIVQKNPSLLSLDVRNNLLPTLTYLSTECSLDVHGMSQLLRSCPGILGLSVEDNLPPKVNFLRCRLGLSDADDFRRCLSRHPQILGLSLDNLRQKVEYFELLEGRDVVDDEDDGSCVVIEEGASSEEDWVSSLAHRVAVAAPSTYSLSLQENIVPKVNHLAKILCGVDLEDVIVDGPMMQRGHSSSGSGVVVSASSSFSPSYKCVCSMISEYPPILTLSLEGNIQPTLRFYNKTGYLSLDSDGWPVENTQTGRTTLRPRYIASSLYARLLPRWHFLQGLGLCPPTGSNTGTIVGDEKQGVIIPPLHVLAGAGDAVFCRHFRVNLDEYTTWKEEAIPQLKFSSQFDTWIKTGRPIDD